MSDRPAIVWRSTPLRLALAAVPLWLTLTVLRFDGMWTAKALVVAVFGIAVASPAYGLLVLAAILPMGRLAALGLHLDPFRVSEAAVLAFFAGWLLVARTDRAGARAPAAPGWAFAAVAALSIAAQCLRLWRGSADFSDVSELFVRAYYPQVDSIGLQTAARFFEGLGLVAATVTLARTKPWLTRALLAVVIVSATAAAASSFLLIRGIGPEVIVAYHNFFPMRTSAHVGDPNAAGSYFAMTLLVTLGVAASARPLIAIAPAAAAAAQAWALWVTSSRTAVAAAAIVIGGTAVAAVAARSRPAVRRIVLLAVIVAAVAIGALRARALQNDQGAVFRRDFIATSLRMIAERPLSGVGVGQYYETSSLFLSPFLAWTYGFENAHNNFLQIGAELGLIGLAAFLWLLAAVLWRGWKAFVKAPRDLPLLGACAGVVVLLVTCLAGHPFLTDEVAYSFWLVFGLVAALSGDVASGAPIFVASAFRRTSLAAAFAILAMAFVWSGSRVVTPSTSTGATGLEPWESDADGTRYRWTGEYASVFVPHNATRIYIAARQPVDVPRLGPMGVGTHIYGEDHGRTIVGPTWATLNIQLPIAVTRQLYKRIDLKVDRAWQPAVYIAGSADMRKLGVQIGEIKTFFEY